MIDQHGEYILSDLLRYYGVDLADVLRPGSGLSARRALALIRGLPLESATVAALRGGPQFRGWGPDRYLTALLIDAVQENTYVLTAANSGKGKKPKPPKPVPRPGAREPGKPANLFAAQARERLKRISEAKKRKAMTDGEGPRD